VFGDEIDLNRVDLDAYCARIGYVGPRTPTFETLRALHRLHPAEIVFETFDARLGLGVALDAPAVDAKLVHSRRGGYCFEQNTLFLRALRTLGFRAEPLIARSLWGRAPGDAHPRTHMVIRVDIDGRPWLADVGFGGCMLTTPLRMDDPSPQETAHEPARLTPSEGGFRLQRLIGDGWAIVCDIVLTPQRPVDLMAANWLISSHPESPFRKRLVVSRTRDDVRHVLVDSRLTIRHAGDVEHRRLGVSELEACLAEVFDLPLSDAWRPLLREIGATDGAA
jgi:N-hydroxyarylamine O-acetyltransferase